MVLLLQEVLLEALAVLVGILLALLQSVELVLALL
jgi:hypothetical protein